MTARHSFDVAGKIAFMLWRHCQRRNGTMPTMRAALLCLLLLGAHEYPVLDRRPRSNDLELDFRWVCAVSCARKIRLWRQNWNCCGKDLRLSRYYIIHREWIEIQNDSTFKMAFLIRIIRNDINRSNLFFYDGLEVKLIYKLCIIRSL